jgi:hypothetical protein
MMLRTILESSRLPLTVPGPSTTTGEMVPRSVPGEVA